MALTFSHIDTLASVNSHNACVQLPKIIAEKIGRTEAEVREMRMQYRYNNKLAKRPWEWTGEGTWVYHPIPLAHPTTPSWQVRDSYQIQSETGHDSKEIIALLENWIADLRNQLEKAESRLQIATTEKRKLLDLLSADKEEKCTLKSEARTDTPARGKRAENRANTNQAARLAYSET